MGVTSPEPTAALPPPEPWPVAPPPLGRHDAMWLALLAIAFLAFVAITWGMWPLLTADSARELYVPFQLRHGAVIYRDFNYLYGPVAPWIQAGLLGVFGEHLAVLYGASVAQVAAILGLLYALSRQVLRAAPSAAVVWIVFTHFSLGPDIWGYLWPYAFAATWGMLFGLVVLLGLARHQAGAGLGWLVLAGFAAGLALVTKLEYGVAAFGTVLAYVAGRLLLRRWLAPRHAAWQEALAALVPIPLAIAPVVATVLAATPWETVQASVWPTALMRLWNSQGTWHGTASSWPSNLVWFALATGFLAMVAWLVKPNRTNLRTLGLVTFFLGLDTASRRFPSVAFYTENAHLYWVGPSFLVLFGVLGLTLWSIRRAIRSNGPIAPTTVVWGLCAGYALLVSLRTLLFGYNDYTRYQAPVAVIAWVGLATLWVPWLVDRGGAVRPARSAMLTAVVVMLGVANAEWASRGYFLPREPVTGPVGTVLAEPSFARPFNEAVKFLNENLTATQAFVALPMEASLYLFTGRDCPVRENQLFFGYLATPAEELDFIDRLRAKRVRFVVKSSYAYRGKVFGQDYMPKVAAFMSRDCVAKRTFAHPEASGDKYALSVFETPKGFWTP